MAQGKLKVKAKLPQNTKNKNKEKKIKGPTFTKRNNRPIQSKKHLIEQGQKIKRNLSKALNRAVEDEMRSRAYDGTKKLSKAQEAVVAHHKSQPAPSTSTTASTSS